MRSILISSVLVLGLVGCSGMGKRDGHHDHGKCEKCMKKEGMAEKCSKDEKGEKKCECSKCDKKEKAS